MLVIVASILFGLAILVWGADKFVDGAVSLSAGLGISELLCGILIVGLATSAPELFVSAGAALESKPLLGIANALGSNIANIGLVLGLTIMLSPKLLEVPKTLSNIALMVVAMVVAFFVLYDLRLAVIDGILLLAVLALSLVLSVRFARADEMGEPRSSLPDYSRPMNLYKAIFVLFLGLGMLLAGAKMLVWGAVDLARVLGVSETVIGLTIVAVGTSLPELAASLIGVFKRKSDIAIGNIIGSNVFNSLAVLAMPAFLAPTDISKEIFFRDVCYMLGVGLMLLLVVLMKREKGYFSRTSGGVMLVSFISYQFIVYLSI